MTSFFRRRIVGDYTAPPGRKSKLVFLLPKATVTASTLLFFDPDPELNGDQLKGLAVLSSANLSEIIVGNETKTLNNSDGFTGGVIELRTRRNELLIELPLSVLVPENVNGLPQLVYVKDLDWSNCRVKFFDGGTITVNDALVFRVFYNG